ncbi:hypothetical protein BDZ91DRAFT_727962 [Kalaharituber pfeilii]|nr:hypothetical protein BDZ91DRAFT_727962 [Kalaharituber pfeilii]
MVALHSSSHVCYLLYSFALSPSIYIYIPIYIYMKCCLAVSRNNGQTTQVNRCRTVC